MKRLLAIPLLAIMLPGGCVQGDDAHLNVVHDPVYIDRPVACVPAAKIPAPPAKLGKRPDDTRAAALLAFSKVNEWEGYGEHADPLLKACAKAP